MNPLRSERLRSVLVAVGAIGAVFWAALNTQPSFASNLSLTLTINGGSNAISLDIASLSSNGTFRTSDTTTNNISVSTNNFTGYTLGIMAKVDGGTALINQSDNTKTLPSITATVSPTNYADDTYAKANSLNNTWGYRPSTLYDSTNDTNVSNTDYLPAPTSTETASQTIIAKTSRANTIGTSDPYNIAIGARVNNDTAPGNYTNTFVITAVANPINYTISFDKGNTTDTVSNLPSDQTGVLADPSASTNIVLANNTPTRTGYAFAGWCSVMPTTINNVDSCSGTTYSAGGTYDLNPTINPNVTLYAIWAEPPTDLTFKVGEGIETVIVVKANTTDKYAPSYATSGEDVVIPNPAADSKYIVTVVPAANYKLDNWSRLSNIGSFDDSSLLTTTFTAGDAGDTIVANGISGTYTNKMKDLALANCPASGINVTDERDNKSYTVAKIGNYCYMLSNLRLEGGTALTTATSNVTADAFTLPDQTTWTSSSQNHYCEARMRYINNEYYYNWYAAKANPTTGLTSSISCSTTTIEAASLGSICPAGWQLPTYSDITPANIWDSGNNPGALATTGSFRSGSQYNVGSRGYWWSSSRNGNNGAYYLAFNGTSASRSSGSFKYYGYSVRCMRSS